MKTKMHIFLIVTLLITTGISSSFAQNETNVLNNYNGMSEKNILIHLSKMPIVT